MKTNFLSDAIMSLLHQQGVQLAYENAVANEYVHMLQCDCYQTCSGGCEGGCMGDCASGCFDSSR